MPKRSIALQLDLALDASDSGREQLALDLGGPADDATLSYRLTRSEKPGSRKVRIRREGDVLAVSAPRDAPIKAIENTVRAHATMPSPREKNSRLPQHWTDGAQLGFLGHMLTVRLDERVARAVHIDQTLHLPLAADASSERIRDSVHAFLQQEARRVFGQLLMTWAQKFGCPLPEWNLTLAARITAEPRGGRLLLNWLLVLNALPEIESALSRALLRLHPGIDEMSLWDDLPG